MLSPGLSPVYVHALPLWAIKVLAGLQHPHGQVQGLPWLEQWGKAHQAAAGAGGPCRGHFPGVGLLLLPLWCQPVRHLFCLPVVWSQNEALPVEIQATMAPFSPLTTSQICPGGHLVGLGRVECSRVKCSWRRLSSQLGHGTGCISSALLSLFSVRCDDLK